MLRRLLERLLERSRVRMRLRVLEWPGRQAEPMDARAELRVEARAVSFAAAARIGRVAAAVRAAMAARALWGAQVSAQASA